MLIIIFEMNWWNMLPTTNSIIGCSFYNISLSMVKKYIKRIKRKIPRAVIHAFSRFTWILRHFTVVGLKMYLFWNDHKSNSVCVLFTSLLLFIIVHNRNLYYILIGPYIHSWFMFGICTRKSKQVLKVCTTIIRV